MKKIIFLTILLSGSYCYAQTAGETQNVYIVNQNEIASALKLIAQKVGTGAWISTDGSTQTKSGGLVLGGKLEGGVLVYSSASVGELYIDGVLVQPGGGQTLIPGGARTFYFNSNISSPGLYQYETLLTTPDASAETTNTITLNSGSGKVVIDSYTTIPGVPFISRIPAGIWTFILYGNVDSEIGATQFVVHLSTSEKNDTKGNEIYISSSSEVNHTFKDLTTINMVISNDINISTDAHIKIHVYGLTSSVGSRNLTFYHGGTDSPSHIDTTISQTARFTDLDDTPSSLIGNIGKSVVVQSETDLGFSEVTLSTVATAVNEIISSSNSYWMNLDGSTPTKTGGATFGGNVTATQFVGDGSLLTGLPGGDGLLDRLYDVVIGTLGAVSATVDIASDTEDGLYAAINTYAIGKSSISIVVTPGYYTYKSATIPSHVSITYMPGAVVRASSINVCALYLYGMVWNFQPNIVRHSTTVPFVDLKWGSKIYGNRPVSYQTNNRVSPTFAYRVLDSSEVAVYDSYFQKIVVRGETGGSDSNIFLIQNSTSVLISGLIIPNDYDSDGLGAAVLVKVFASDNLVLEKCWARDLYRAFAIDDNGVRQVGNVLVRQFYFDQNAANGRAPGRGGFFQINSDETGIGISTGVVFMDGRIHLRGNEATDIFYIDSSGANSDTSKVVFHNITITSDGSYADYVFAAIYANGVAPRDTTFRIIDISGIATGFNDSGARTKAYNCTLNNNSIDQ